MRKHCFYWCCLLLGWGGSLCATGDSTAYLLPTDTIMLDLDFAGELAFQHGFEQKQTLYGLSHHYGMPVTELYAYNPGLSPATVSVHDKIKIPIPAQAVELHEPPRWLRNLRYVPVYFRVKRGDTVYGISKRYFPGLNMDTLRQRNALVTDALSHGKVLFIGWMSVDGVPKEMRAEMGPGGRQNYLHKLAYYRHGNGKTEKKERGAATWEKHSQDGGLYAMHRTVPVGRYIKVYNPNSKVTLYLKVIGRMPPTAYDPETIVFVSPRAAKLLNGRDRRFYVRISYY